MKVMESTELCQGRAVYIGKQNKAKRNINSQMCKLHKQEFDIIYNLKKI